MIELKLLINVVKPSSFFTSDEILEAINEQVNKSYGIKSRESLRNYLKLFESSASQIGLKNLETLIDSKKEFNRYALFIEQSSQIYRAAGINISGTPVKKRKKINQMKPQVKRHRSLEEIQDSRQFNPTLSERALWRRNEISFYGY